MDYKTAAVPGCIELQSVSEQGFALQTELPVGAAHAEEQYAAMAHKTVTKVRAKAADVDTNTAASTYVVLPAQPKKRKAEEDEADRDPWDLVWGTPLAMASKRKGKIVEDEVVASGDEDAPPPAAAAASGPAASGKRKIKSIAKDDVDGEEPEQKSQRGGKAKGGAKKGAKGARGAAAAAIADVDDMGLGIRRERQKVSNAMAAAESVLTEGGPLRPPQAIPLLGAGRVGWGRGWGVGGGVAGWTRRGRPAVGQGAVG